MIFFFLKKRGTTGCSKKNYTLFWRAVAPLNFELGIKVGVFWNPQVLSFSKLSLLLTFDPVKAEIFEVEDTRGHC